VANIQAQPPARGPV